MKNLMEIETLNGVSSQSPNRSINEAHEPEQTYGVEKILSRGRTCTFKTCYAACFNIYAIKLVDAWCDADLACWCKFTTGFV
ncbi:hypothetical protein PVAND_003308 [Polypedilum vanderplanki]|uniref:Uncharacterized protein n=1 Tax=Polypedilum vanderplanki TaxID=319348 RepID=A0A9J6BUM7_POLVA|nr:hypothetical protein PVAND_003308 [Polypedilum vanderplanki]